MRFVRTLRSVFFLFGLMLAAGSLLACANVVPHITAATLGTTVQASKIADPKTTFAPRDHMIHLVVQVDNAIQNTGIGAKWYALDPGKRLLYETNVTLDAFNTSADLALTNTNDWTPGNYQVIIYLNGTEDRTLNFAIK